MSDAPFKVSDDFDRLNREIHRRRCPPVGAPSASRHVVLWADQEELRSTEIKQVAAGRQKWIEACRAYVASVAATIQGAHVDLAPDHMRPFASIEHDRVFNRELPWPENDHFIMIGNWQGTLIKFVMALHTEYVTISFHVCLDKPPATAVADKIVLDASSAAFRCVGEAVRNSMVSIDPNAKHDAIEAANGPQPATPGLREAVDYLHARIWDDFDSAVASYWQLPANAPHREAIGTMVADFRGMSLRIDGTVFFGDGDREAFVGKPSRFSDPSLRDQPPFFSAVADAGGYGEDLRAQRALKSVWPILDAFQPDSVATANTEFVASRMLDGRAIYVSSLGNIGQIPVETLLASHHTPSPPVKIRYALLVGPHDRWQHGRLIERIHNLGTLRIAALYGLARIRSAGIETRLAGIELTELFQEALGRSERKKRSGDRTAEEFQARVNRVLARINGIGHPESDDLLYRINRSRYFVQRIRQNLPELRSQRIEGWQPYHQFVERRLFSTFDFIDRVGARYTALRERASNLVNLINANEIHSQTRRTVSLLRVADVVGAAAFTYYFGSIIHSGWPTVAAGQSIERLWAAGIALVLFFILRALTEYFSSRDG